ncbi:ATP-binding protein [Falsihalocynthiibacter arcticus]|uniref:AAA+ ATPase domain-containing protein n=1 Tax=Falsihalocynthiibacter arcticus TaxID=1579316 RepID=A0A126V210_9RHOB|nr:ATP-binding protein [Falsihalocynthiibacter arcticus]AML51926.1 hypothetical protein RC74_12200 [Falsihalocynthiibacter arcticus]
MNSHSGPRPDTDIDAALTAEMNRVEALMQAVSRHRGGKSMGAAPRSALAAAQAAVAIHRQSGVFADLTAKAPCVDPDLALDCLMIVALTIIRPSKAWSLQALIPGGSADFAMTQGLIHELLMPDDDHEGRLSRALAPHGDLICNGLLRAEGAGPTRQLRPGFALARFIAGSEAALTPPDGVRLVFQPGDPVQKMFLSPRIGQRLAELESLVRLLASRDTGMAGPSALFTGGPGTGKSLAVLHMAHRLKRPLYQVDLGRVVSKWIGETERNLSRVFGEMSGTAGCILIDEADALLGKRVEVKESRDQHANVTVSHLLSLLERHRGPVFLTSNLRGNLDPAYIRRFACVVDFHRPTKSVRQQIWGHALARAAPDLDSAICSDLVTQSAPIEMSAAEISNAAVVAVALSEYQRHDLTASDLARAIMLEKTKGGMTFSREDLGPLAAFWYPEDPV